MTSVTKKAQLQARIRKVSAETGGCSGCHKPWDLHSGFILVDLRSKEPSEDGGLNRPCGPCEAKTQAWWDRDAEYKRLDREWGQQLAENGEET